MVSLQQDYEFDCTSALAPIIEASTFAHQQPTARLQSSEWAAISQHVESRTRLVDEWSRRNPMAREAITPIGQPHRQAPIILNQVSHVPVPEFSPELNLTRLGSRPDTRRSGLALWRWSE
jgi:hypothetical protein